MPININVNVTLDDEFISDVLVTAFDGQYGACWYWCNTSPIATLREDGSEGMSAYKVDGEQWKGVRIKPDHLGDKVLDGLCEKGIWVDAEVVRVGIQRLMSGDNQIRNDLMEHLRTGVLEGDAGEVDAEVADVIVQAGLFGRIIFG